MILPWLILFLVICALSLADLHVLNRKPSVHKPSTAMLWFSFYLLLAMAFNAALYVIYNRNPLEIGASGTIRDGHQASFEFLSALLLDLALDLDMVFVFSAVFAHFKTPEELQRRVLLWGVVMTQLVQGPVIFMLSRGLDAPGFGGALRLTLAAVLVVAAFRMILMRRDTLAVESNPLYKLLTRMLPITESGERGTLMTRVQGKYAFTPLVFTLAVLTTAELVFSLDSIPATFAVCSDPLIIFAANGIGLLCMRSLYFAIKDAKPALRYIKVGLALTLVHCAIAIALPQSSRLPPEIFLAVILAAVGIGLSLAAIYRSKPAQSQEEQDISPLGPEADRIARHAVKHGRKVLILVLGISVVVVGIIMIVAPGPAVIVIPAGLALLATEFIWARRLLVTYHTHAVSFTKRAGDAMVKKPRPWLIPPVLALLGGALYGATRVWEAQWVLLAASPFVAFTMMWTVTTVRKTIELRRSRSAPPEG